jgi:tight adherence protein C
MEPNFLLQYPEFVLAGAVGVAFFVTSARHGATTGSFEVPIWVTDAGATVAGVLPAGYSSWLNKRLVWSGYRGTSATGTFLFIKTICALAMSLAGLFAPLWLVVLLVPVLFFIPDVVLLILCKRRQKEIAESLPQALDLMVLCVDAGLGLDATLQRVTSERSNIAKSLNDELLVLGRDILLGMDRERAYSELHRRTGVDELKSLASALNQAGKLGLSIAKILRNQSEFLRMKQGQKAEERAHKLPIYMAFPLWFCIMPALLLLVLGPSIIRFIQQAQPGLLP